MFYPNIRLPAILPYNTPPYPSSVVATAAAAKREFSKDLKAFFAYLLSSEAPAVLFATLVKQTWSVCSASVVVE